MVRGRTTVHVTHTNTPTAEMAGHPSPTEVPMADVLFIAITIAFFLICVAYVTWCDRIIGPDEFGPANESDLDSNEAHDETVAGSRQEVRA